MDKICRLEYLEDYVILDKLSRNQNRATVTRLISNTVLYDLFNKEILNIYHTIATEVDKANTYKYSDPIVTRIDNTNFYNKPPLLNDSIFDKERKRVNNKHLKCTSELRTSLISQKKLLIDVSIDMQRINRFLYKAGVQCKNNTSITPLLEILPKETIKLPTIQKILIKINYREVIGTNPFVTQHLENNLIKDKILLNKLLG